MGHGPTPTKASAMGHPIHPMLIPFPIAFGTAVLFTDVAYWVSDERTWALASAWLLWAAFGTGVLAAIPGAIDYLTSEEVRSHRQATQHGVGNGVVLILILANALWRATGVEDAVLPWGLALTVVASCLLAVTGYLGGELSYTHMIGVDPGDLQHEDERPSDSASARRH